MKVIIVDDAPFVREVLNNILVKLGHTVVAEADDGMETLEKVLKYKPDVIFLDLVLPKMNGLDVAQKIIELYPEAKMIACSTLEREKFEQQALDSGCKSYLQKPFNIEDIKTALNNL